MVGKLKFDSFKGPGEDSDFLHWYQTIRMFIIKQILTRIFFLDQCIRNMTEMKKKLGVGGGGALKDVFGSVNS